MPEPHYPRTPADQARTLRESLRLASELADALGAQAARVKRQCQQLQDTIARMPDLPERTPGPAGGETRRRAAGNGEPQENPARLAAMEMAIQGASRGEIEAYLRNHLTVAEVKEILDEVLRGRPD